MASKENRSITSLSREALSEYVNRKTIALSGRKITDFFGDSVRTEVVCSQVLTPSELNDWTDAELLRTTKLLRSRQQELGFELRRRKFFFSW